MNKTTRFMVIFATFCNMLLFGLTQHGRFVNALPHLWRGFFYYPEYTGGHGSALSS